MYMLQKDVNVYQAKVAMHSRSHHHECMVVVPLNHEVVFVAHGLIFYR